MDRVNAAANLAICVTDQGRFLLAIKIPIRGRAMAKLSYAEKRNLEEFLQMGSGYVLNFSNRTFRDFVIDSTGLDPDDERVAGTGSKACRLRQFMQIQPDHVVGKLLKDMIEYHDPDGDSPLRKRCMAIAERLLHSAPVPDSGVIAVLSEREEFEQLAKSVLDSIHKNDPQGGLDRLHTFTTKFVRSLCENHRLTIDRDKPLHSTFGELREGTEAAQPDRIEDDRDDLEDVHLRTGRLQRCPEQSQFCP